MTTVNHITDLMKSLDVSQAAQDLRNWRNPKTDLRLKEIDFNKLLKSCELLETLAYLKRQQKSTSKSIMLQSIAAKKMTDLYNAVYQIINEFKLPLPASRRIEGKVTNYIKDGAISLISKKRTMRNAVKVEGDDKKFLAYLMSHHNRLDNRQIANMYNKAMVELGREDSTIHHTTVSKIRSKGRELLTSLAGAQGKAGIRDLMMYRDRFRPSQALILTSSDGWDVELAYKDIITYGNKSRRTVYGLRHNMVVISDACCDFPIGWAIGTKENSQLIKQALRNAMKYIKETLGNYYYFGEYITDRFGSDDLKKSYGLIAGRHKFSNKDNPNDKPIEQWFKQLNKRCQMEWNWTGYGNQSKTKHNTDLTSQTEYKKHQKTKAENLEQINEIMVELQKQKLSVWLAMFDQNALKPMTEEDYLIALGEYRMKQNGKDRETYRLSHKGIKIVRNYEETYYQTFDTTFKEYALVKWHIIEDPEDPAKVLAVSPDGTLTYMLHAQQSSPMAISDRTEQHNKYDAQIEEHNKRLIKQIVAGHDENYNAALAIFKELEERGANVEQLEKLAPTLKGLEKDLLKLTQHKKAIELPATTTETKEEQDAISAALEAF